MSQYWKRAMDRARESIGNGPPSDGYGEWAASQFTTKNEFAWPPHRRRYIVRIEQRFNHLTQQHEYLVKPRNPEWIVFQEQMFRDDRGYPVHAGIGKVVNKDGEVAEIPPMSLDTITFETAMEIDEWARVCARLDGKQE